MQHNICLQAKLFVKHEFNTCIFFSSTDGCDRIRHIIVLATGLTGSNNPAKCTITGSFAVTYNG